MINYNCKLCNTLIFTNFDIKKSNWYRCDKCLNYTIWTDHNSIVKEWIHIAKACIYLEINTLTKETYLWLNNICDDKRLLAPIEELTPQLAQEWLNKLKLYMVIR